MEKQFLILSVLFIIGSGVACSVLAEIANPYQMTSNLHTQINQQVLDTMGMTLQDIAEDYTPYSRIGWKIVVNGIDESKDLSKMEWGYGQVTGYDSSSGILSGIGQMFGVSPGSTATSPNVDSFGTVTINIDVGDNTATLFTSGSNPGLGTAWAKSLGQYTDLQDAGNRVFYGFGNHPDYSHSMCILTISNLQGSTPSDEEEGQVGYVEFPEYTDKTPIPTPTLVMRKDLSYPISK